MKNLKKYTLLLSIAALLMVTAVISSCNPLIADLTINDDLGNGKLTVSCDDSDVTKFVFTAAASNLGNVNLNDISWYVDGTKKGTGETLTMNKIDYGEGVHYVRAVLQNNELSYSDVTSVSIQYAILYHGTFTTAYQRGDYVVMDINMPMIVDDGSATDAVTGDSVNLITWTVQESNFYRKDKEYPIYLNEYDQYTYYSEGTPVPATSTNTGFIGTIFTCFDGNGGSPTNGDRMLFNDGTNTYFMTVNTNSAPANTSMHIVQVDTMLRYPTDKKIMNPWNSVIDNASEYVLYNGDKYYVTASLY